MTNLDENKAQEEEYRGQISLSMLPDVQNTIPLNKGLANCFLYRNRRARQQSTEGLVTHHIARQDPPHKSEHRNRHALGQRAFEAV